MRKPTQQTLSDLFKLEAKMEAAADEETASLGTAQWSHGDQARCCVAPWLDNQIRNAENQPQSSVEVPQPLLALELGQEIWLLPLVFCHQGVQFQYFHFPNLKVQAEGAERKAEGDQTEQRRQRNCSICQEAEEGRQ